MNTASNGQRAYDMTRRAASAARTRQAIVDATEHLLTTETLAAVTLPAIANEAGCTVQTVLRHMQSRDGCMAAVSEQLAARIIEERDAVPSGNVTGAVTTLVDHYERDGLLILNLLGQEHGEDPLAANAVRAGRDYHRKWVIRCFAPELDSSDEIRVDAVVAATDLYTWKLLRQDLGRSVEQVRTVMTHLVNSQLINPQSESK